jgi:hypothetical protein
MQLSDHFFSFFKKKKKKKKSDNLCLISLLSYNLRSYELGRERNGKEEMWKKSVSFEGLN